MDAGKDESVLKVLPEHVPSLSTLGSVFLVNGENDQAPAHCLIAEKLAQTDDFVIGNIAEAYGREGEIGLAIKYCERTDLGGAQTKEFAKAQIEALKK